MILPSGIKLRADDEEDYDRLDLTEIHAYAYNPETRREEEIDLVKSDEAGNITYHRTHTVASTNVKYSTKHLIMSARTLTKNEDITKIIEYEENKPAEYLKGEAYVKVPLSQPTHDDVGLSEVTTNYYFFNEDINKVAKALGIRDIDDGAEDGFIQVYLTHVFEIMPKSQSAWDDLKKAVGKISNTANDKPGNGGGRHELTAGAYDNGKDSLLWYKTMKEFVEPGGDSTFWSRGTANDKMYACMNIRLQVKVNPKVYGAPLSVFYYDQETKETVKVVESDPDIEIPYSERRVYGASDELKKDDLGYLTLEANGEEYVVISNDIEAFRLNKESSRWEGYEKDKTRTAVKSKHMSIDTSDNLRIEITNAYTKTKKIAVYIPVKSSSIKPPPDTPEEEEEETTNEDPDLTPTGEPTDTSNLKVYIVYYDEKDPDKAPVKTVVAEKEGEVGKKNYTATLDSRVLGGTYAIDKDGTALAVYGSRKNVRTKYVKAVAANKYEIKTFTTSKVVIKDALKEAKYTAIWVPVKEGPKVKVHYIDEAETELGTDDGGVAEKGKAYSYRINYDKVSNEYDIRGELSYFKKGGTKTYAGILGDDVKIDPFPFDEAVDLYIPCELKESPTGTGTYFSWDAMRAGASAVIRSDTFDVETAIPSSEGVYGKITAASTLSRGNLSVFTGTKTYTISVKQWATRSWYLDRGYWPDPVPVHVDPDDPTSPIDHYEQPDYVKNDVPTSDSDWVTSSVTVTLPWTYYTVDDYALYNLVKAVLTNGSLDEAIVINTSNEKKEASATHYDEESDHVKDPAGYTSADMVVTISGTLTSSSSGYSAPSWPTINSSTAETAVKNELGAVQVRNDKFTFAGTEVMKDDWVKETDAHTPSTGILAAGGAQSDTASKTIPAYKGNQIYDDSTGKIYYSLSSSLNSDDDGEHVTSVPVNGVVVHTPIICNVTIASDNMQFVQAPSVDTTKYQIVVGRSDAAGVGSSATNNPNMTADFTVEFSNYGTHKSYMGYGTKDYHKYLKQDSRTGLSGNMFCFPFDVIADIGNDYNEANDVLFKADTWNAYYSDTMKLRFYIPEWVEEGIYDMEFKSVACNGIATSRDEEYANLNIYASAASAEDSLQVTGKIYGFTLYDIDTSSEWSDVFRLGSTLKYLSPDKYTDGTTAAAYDKNKRYYYTAGARNELGILTGRLAKYSVPILQGGNPKYKNLGILKAGYTWRFKFDTVSAAMADDGAKIVITPTFYHIDADGGNRTKVNLYYSDTIGGKTKSLIKVGGTTDMGNVKTNYSGNPDFGINKDELKDTARIKGAAYNTMVGTIGDVYAYGGMISNNLFKTYSNKAYAERIVAARLNGTKTKDEIIKAKQTWYFEYSLPEFHACAYNFDLEQYVKDKGSVTYKEAFWYTDGYIIVNFDISAYDINGNKIMSYSNEAGAAGGLCNMFLMESMGRSTGTKDMTDANGTVFNLYGGDVFIVYANPDKMRSSDYGGDHLN